MARGDDDIPDIDPEDLYMDSIPELSIEQKMQARWNRDHMSKFEASVWKFLGQHDNWWGFLRQIPYRAYYLDFYSPHYKVALEADGPEHAMRKRSDAERDKALLADGIITIRICPADFVKKHPSEILAYIDNAVKNGRDQPIQNPDLPF